MTRVLTAREMQDAKQEGVVVLTALDAESVSVQPGACIVAWTNSQEVSSEFGYEGTRHFIEYVGYLDGKPLVSREIRVTGVSMLLGREFTLPFSELRRRQAFGEVLKTLTASESRQKGV
jgi:hypothetical protein